MSFLLPVIGIVLIAVFLIIQNKLEDVLDDHAYAHANDTFQDQYFDHVSGTFYRQSLQLKGHRLIHRNQGVKRTINLYQVKSVSIRFLRVSIKLNNGDTIRLPLGFAHLPDIYTILKYYRPDESRSALSTRHS